MAGGRPTAGGATSTTTATRRESLSGGAEGTWIGGGRKIFSSEERFSSCKTILTYA